MLLFDTSDMDVDVYLEDRLEKANYYSSYLIMNKDTFRLFKLLSNQYDKKCNYWKGENGNIPIAIDKKLTFGEVVFK